MDSKGEADSDGVSDVSSISSYLSDLDNHDDDIVDDQLEI